jgi:hypothetical protein
MSTPITLDAVNKMTSEEYKENLRSNPDFSATVERLYKEAAARANGETIIIEETPAGASPAIVPTPAPTPVVAAPVAELPDQRYEYQPMDADGRPLGGKQVIIYKTPDELTTKLVKQNELILRQLRKVSREKALGVEEAVPDTAERFQNVPEFKSRDLTPDERFTIARELVNPETTASATDKLIESVFGQKPSVVANTLNEVQRSLIQNRAVENYIDFVNSGSGYVDSPENREIVTRWMGKRNLAPTVANFKLAQDTLSGAGLLKEAPDVQQVSLVPTAAPAAVVPVELEVPNPQALPATTPGLGTQPQAQAKRQSHVPSGLNESISSASSGVTTPGVGGSSITLRDIDRMTSEQYRAALRDPEFQKTVNRLEAEAAKARAVKSGATV